MNCLKKQTRLSLSLLFIFLAISTFAQYPYGVPETPWAESLGNHRAVVIVDKPADRIVLDFTWRRHDPDPQKKAFLIIQEESGDTIPIIQRIEVNAERCHLIFGPVEKAGTYFFYYLPYQVQEGWGFYGGDYLRPETQDPGNKSDLRNNKEGQGALNRARVSKVEARTEFDSFYPMEVIALQAEKDSLLKHHQEPVLVFCEDRSNPVRMQDDIPLKWIHQGPSSHFEGRAGKNEYYVFQVAAWTPRLDIDDIQIQYDQTPQVFNGITCFNKEGTDPYGTPFTNEIAVAKGKIQALWFGIDLPEDIPPGTYTGHFRLNFLSDQAIDPVSIEYAIEIADTLLTDRGDGEPWRHSRLRWLNSEAGIDHQPVAPYDPIRISGDHQYQTRFSQLTKSASGLPGQLKTSVSVLADAVNFGLKNEQESIQFSYSDPVTLMQEPGEYQWKQQWNSEGVNAHLESSLESDGYQHYTISLSVIEPMHIEDIFLEIPFNPAIAEYMMGMNLPGCTVPTSHRTHWQKPQDAFWIGNTAGGLWCEIRGSSYHGPLLNLYKPGHPRPWYNDDKGYLSITKTKTATIARVGTGAIELYPGEKWVFSFALLPTPVKKLHPAEQFTNRYYHSGAAPEDVEEELKNGVRIVNIHHANQYNPYINYPFIAVDELHQIIEQYHASGLKVKIYYTIRELTNHVTEIWALRSLGNEIFRDGGGGGYPWLREHFISGYYPQWYQHFENGSPDASILTATTASRWYNYYVEGLRWLIENQDIDGLYLDDVSYDRRMLKRMRKVMEETQPGCMIDLHSNTGFSIGPAIQYTEFFPYVDKLWFGESFQYNQMTPENWLVEVSGIPFGLMGDMLHGGGNRWLGMIFGMTVRLPWTSEGNTADPRPIWNFWDEFGIAESRMIGFWEKDLPVYLSESRTQDELMDVKATVYQKSNSFLVAIANFGESGQTVHLDYRWDRLGLNPEHCEFFIPEIKNFQDYEIIHLGEDIYLEAKEGRLIWVKEVK